MDPSTENKSKAEEILEKVTRQERKLLRGRHKVFLGFAAGVGKTYEMLNEANRRRKRGQDVVVGYLETHGRKGTEEQICDLEVVPRKQNEYRGTTFEEMDTQAIIERHPQYVLVDELAHTNVPGSDREKRWQDVEVILDAGINVLSTMNVQHLDSLSDTVHDITGIWMRETVPDHALRDADEVIMVDITPRALIHRLERGDIYKPDKVQQALQNWFREGNLGALREIALREVAHEVDEDVSAYRKDRNVKETWATHDRIMVCISPTKPSMRLIRRGWRMAERLHAEIVAVYVEGNQISEVHRQILHNDFALAERLKVAVITLKGDVAAEIIRYARENQITQIVIGHSSRSQWQEIRHGSIIGRLTRELRTIDILIVACPSEDQQ
jgi:two-component system sensor histidine kinase KdpD